MSTGRTLYYNLQSTSIETSDLENQSFSFSAKLFDTSGELKKAGNSSNGKIIFKINDLPGGQYYLHVTSGGETVASQIIIEH